MKNFLKKSSLIDFLFIFVLSLTPLLWFKGGSVMFGHDNVFPLEPLTFLVGRLSTWTGHGFGESQSLIMGTIPIHLIDAIPSSLGLSLQETQKVVYVFWFFMMGISMYILAHTINPKSSIFKLTSTVLYQFNFFILQAWWVGERTKFSAYIAFPLILSVFLKVYWNKINPIKGAIYTALILFIFNAGGLFGISLYGGFFIAMITFILFFSFISFFRKEFSVIKRLFLLVFLSGFAFVLINAYYIFPAVSQFKFNYTQGLQRSGGSSGFVDWASVISANASYMNIMRLQGIAEWYDNPQHPYAKFYSSNHVLVVVSFLWLILIVGALIFVKKKEKLEMVLYLFTVYLFGIIFTSGTHPPLGFLYEFFIRYVPGAIAFRSPYFKFAPAIFLSSSLLIAYFIDNFHGKIKKIFFISLVAIVLIYHFPYFTGDFFSQSKGFSTKLEVPTYLFQFSRFINKKDVVNGRVLMLPPNNPGLSFSKYKWGYMSFQSLPTFFTNKSVIVNNDHLNQEETALMNTLYLSLVKQDKETVSNLISLLNIEYIVLQEDIAEDEKSDITLDFHVYKNILENDFNFPVVKKIDKWIVYKTNIRTLPTIFTVSNFASLDAGSGKFIEYYNLSHDLNLFAEKVDMPGEAKDLINDYYIPGECLNCKSEDNPFIRIPERSILPGSPFYSLVLFIENRSLKKNAGKALIYDYLGLSLKRIGEIREMIKDDKEIDEDVIKRYNSMLKKINENFNQLESYEDKFKVAKDIKFYLEAERVTIGDLFGVYATHGKAVSIVGDVTSGIATTLEGIDPYLFKLNPVNNRIYEISVEKEGSYNFLVKKDDLLKLEPNRALTINIDNVTKKEIRQDVDASSKWFDFGGVNLGRGKHYMSLSFPESPNIAENLKEEETDINKGNDKKCFTSKIKNFESGRAYSMTLNYKNDFSKDLFYYVWQLKKTDKKLYNVFQLKNTYVFEKFINYISTDQDSKGVLIALCSTNLDQESQKKIGITVNKLLDPSLIAVLKGSSPNNLGKVFTKKISPTEYRVSFENFQKKQLLVFAERFDNGWILSDFNGSHFRINGFANAWVIDKKGNFTLTLEYKSQKVFFLGAIVSLISFIGGLIYLIQGRLRIKKKHD